MADDLLIAFGGGVKLLSSDAESFTVGGYLVRYSGPADPDLTGDFFTKDTDFDLEDGDGLTLYYNHGFDGVLKRRKLGRGHAKFDDAGVWYEAQIAVSDEYAAYIRQLVEEGRLGYSSGAVGHLVERVQVGKAWHIASWPLGEGSLTPTPAEPRNVVAPLKSWLAQQATVPDNQPTDPPMEPQTPHTDPQAVETPTAVTATTEQIKALTDKIAHLEGRLEAQQVKTTPLPGVAAPALLRGGRGDTEAKALSAFFRNNDQGGVKHMLVGENLLEIKASNATDMNIGTGADGGFAVPTGHYQGIIARRDEAMLANLVGVQRIPGIGTTVNVPVDNEADGEFVATNEAANSDLDSPALAQVAMTLVTYTKYVPISNQLIEDEDSRLLSWLDNFVGRGMAKTHNGLLVAEVAAGGTDLGAFAATGAVDAGKLEAAIMTGDLPYYLGEGVGGGNWIMRPATFAAFNNLTGDNRLYAPQAFGSGMTMQPSILGYPVRFSQKVAAIGASNKSVLFGNFGYVGMREAPAFQVLRDPYSLARTGQVALHYYFRTVYKTLIAEAVGWLDHPAS